MLKIKKLSNNGFSHIEMFIVLVVIAAVSFIGYHVYTKSTAQAGSQLLGSISTLHDGTFNITASCKTLAPSTNATTYTFTATASETNPNISYGFDGGASSFFISTQRGAKNVLTNGYTKTSPYPYSTNPDIKVNYNNPAVVIAGTADSISTPKNDWGLDGRVSTKNITIDTKLHPVIYFGTSYSNAFAKPVIRDEFSWLNQSGTPVSSIPTCTVKKITPPSAPQNVKASPQASAITVSWSPPASLGGSQKVSYTAEAKLNGIEVNSCTTDTTSCTIGSLKPLENYLIYTHASNNAGASDPVTTSNIKPYIQDVVYSEGNNLMLNGKQYAFEGINAPWLLSDPNTNMGCYATRYSKSVVDKLFGSIAKGTMVRINAYQDTSISPSSTPDNLINNWSSVDMVFNEAHKYGIYLIPVLADNWSSCDGYSYIDNPITYNKYSTDVPKNKIAKTISWYQNGYKNSFGDGVVKRDSYVAWMNKLVTHLKNTDDSDYKGVPEIDSVGIWEPVGEAQTIQDVSKNTGYLVSKCGVSGVSAGSSGDGAVALTNFFNAESLQLKGLDSEHLISMGTSDHAPQCGLYGAGWQNIINLPNIDIASYHDYSDAKNPASESSSGNSNSITNRIAYAKSIPKPFIDGEMGLADAPSQVLNKSNNDVCSWASANIFSNNPESQRVSIIQSRISAERKLGVSGFMLWAWAPVISMSGAISDNKTCPPVIINSSDPLMSYMEPLS